MNDKVLWAAIYKDSYSSLKAYLFYHDRSLPPTGQGLADLLAEQGIKVDYDPDLGMEELYPALVETQNQAPVVI